LLPLLMGAAPTRTKTYSSGETISSADVTENEDNIYNYLVSGVDTIKDGTVVNADINTSANIQSSKINLTAISQSVANTGTLSNTGNVTITGDMNATTVKQGGYELLPKGMIIMWYSTVATIPDGWVICDGANDTPDLTAHFVMHADADSGGTHNPGDTPTMTSAHVHDRGNHQHTLVTNGDTAERNALEHVTVGATRNSSTHVVSSGSGNTDSTGSQTGYALCFIMKT